MGEHPMEVVNGVLQPVRYEIHQGQLLIIPIGVPSPPKSVKPGSGVGGGVPYTTVTVPEEIKKIVPSFEIYKTPLVKEKATITPVSRVKGIGGSMILAGIAVLVAFVLLLRRRK